MKKTIQEQLTRALVGVSCHHLAGFRVVVVSLSWYKEKCLYHGKTESGQPFAGAVESLAETRDFLENYPELSGSEIEYLMKAWGDPPLTVPEQMRSGG